MSRTTEATGTTFEEALTAAVAELCDVEPDKVELRLRAPGVEELAGRIRFDLEVGSETTGQPDDAGEDDAETSTTADGGAGPRERTEPEDEDEGISIEDLDEEADAAADFLEGLLDAIDLPGDLRIRVLEDHAEVEIVELGSGALIGRRGQTLESIQELLRCALQRQFQRRCRVKVDAEGYRARRLEKLLEKAEDAIEDVLDAGDPVRLEPMDVFERKAVHNLVAENEGITSRSQGREPARRVVIEAAD